MQKTIGLLGGMSWESTAVYYEHLNKVVAQQLGGLHSAKIVMVSLDFDEVASLQKEGRWEGAALLLSREARRLESAGADLILLCTNTMHKVVDQIQTRIPVLHIGDCVAGEAKNRKLKRLGLIATRFTMEERFYIDRLEAQGLEVFVPSADERVEVHRIIYDELCKGVVSAESKAVLREIIRELRKSREIEGLILGCTELCLILQERDFPDLPLLDSTRIHCSLAVSRTLGLL